MATIRRIIGSLALAGIHVVAYGQQQEDVMPAAVENNLEHQAAGTETVSEDDEQWQQLNAWRRHQLQLNTADEASLQALGLLTPLQISNFLQYRSLLGDLLSIYELQAIPGFEPEIIRRILPYVEVGNDLSPHYKMKDYLRKGDHALLMRYGRTLEKARGYLHTDSTPAAYRGSPDKLLLRYRYNFPRYLSWGMVMEKDAGEAFFKGAQQQGFDFYSVHFFLRNYRGIKALALGDYTVNLGQGLLNWQSQAFGKGAAVVQIKREGEVIRPYASPGEFYFFRGAAITLQRRRWEVTAFASHRKLDASPGPGADSSQEEMAVASLVSSGYHRTITETEKRGQAQLISAGGNIRYNSHRWKVGGNLLLHRFTPAWQKERKPYNQFDFSGKQLSAASIDYAGSWKNVHVFGEVATAGNGQPAFMQGLLTSVAPSVDIALVYRYYDKAYQSLFANGFGDGYRTVNEQGLYTATTVKVSSRFKLDAYADIFRFPWLKYRSSGPSGGKEFFLQGTYMLGRQITMLLRYNYRRAEENIPETANPVPVLTDITSRNIRLQSVIQQGRRLSFRTRIEYSSYQAAAVAGMQRGWMIYQDCSYRLLRIPVTVSGRLARFKTSSYDTRIYATENSVLYENAVSQLYGRGWQYYLNMKWKVNARCSCWGRFHQTIYQGAQQVGSGNDMIAGNKKTMVQFQLQYLINGK
ncbi:helix-hairpin-helix protein [Chitinophaga polysaccharea]|uniref:Helix-hairpin-helix protein n=1 Tax=Chitinophaga polysaccharea TaxID=1293035 RepID=A0A561PGX8_9BACT|nr:helix-hairpin-helix domain-containing protein [Chitinophaga polysaccharea]TWF37378.1 helix-hairpin-helix protein [Chitinophaga polysaccharea]